MERGEHLREEGLQAIINIRASLNLGLSEVLKAAFPNTIPVVRPLISQKNKNRNSSSRMNGGIYFWRGARECSLSK